MESQILSVAANQGLWAMLFVALLFWVLKDSAKREKEMRTENEKRENKYQEIISKLSDEVMERVKDLTEIVRRWDEGK